MNMLRRGLLVAALLAPAPLVPTMAWAQGSGPAAPAQMLDDALLAAMRAGKATPFATREQALTPIVQQAFDLPQIVRNAVGPRFASFPPAGQQQLLAVFTEFTVASYIANFDSFDGQRFEILPNPRRTGSDVVVQTRLVPNAGDPVKLDYVMRQSGGTWKIVDVLLDGSISRVAVQRSDFRSLVGSGDPSALIATLRKKVDALASGERE